MRGAYILFGLAAAAQAAEAGPWTREDGEIYARLELSRNKIEGIRATRADLYGEYGIDDRWTLTLKSEAQAFDRASDFNSETYRLTVRRQIFSRGRFLISAEGGVVYGATPGVLGGCQRLGGELGLSAGISGNFLKRDIFAAIDGAVRQQEDGCQTEKLDFVFGSSLGGKWYTVSKVFLERGNAGQYSDKIDTAIMRRFGDTDLAIGWRTEISGRFSERALHISIAHRF